MSDLRNILNMIDKEHSILITEQIGLMGNADYNVSKTFDELREVSDLYPDIKLGDKFTVITSDAVLLFDDYVDLTGIIYENDGKISYIFKLKDLKIQDNVWSLLNDDLEEDKPVIVYYTENILYTNSKELSGKYVYKEALDVVFNNVNNKLDKIIIDGITYIPKTLSFKNSIYSFSQAKR